MIKLLATFLVGLTFNITSTGAATYPNNPESDPPSQWNSMLSTFPRHCNPFGISVFAQGWPRDKFVHACNVLAQMLDNDQDGCADDVNVVKYMRKNQGGMGMFADEASENYDLLPESFGSQELYADETELSCSGSDETADCRDAAIEEIFHVIQWNGISPAYSSQFGECFLNVNNLSIAQEQMDIARGGHYLSVPSSYPSGAIYHYYEPTCDYQCQTAEFLYWCITSYLNGQDARTGVNAIEWEASTKSDLQNKMPTIYNLFQKGNDSSMVLLSPQGVLPGSGGSGATNTYKPSSQTCSGGCALDGSGCGTLGNQPELDTCDGVTLSPVPQPVSSPTISPVSSTFSPTKETPVAEPIEPPTSSPLISPTPPTSSNCVDSELKMLVNSKPRSCGWVAAKNTAKRCTKRGVLTHCPQTCAVCDTEECSDSIKRFRLSNGNLKSCQWVGRVPSLLQSRCEKTGVRATCRATCQYCSDNNNDDYNYNDNNNDDGNNNNDDSTGTLNGEEACENRGYSQSECLQIGNSCCEWDDDQCWSAIGTQICTGL